MWGYGDPLLLLLLRCVQIEVENRRAHRETRKRGMGVERSRIASIRSYRGLGWMPFPTHLLLADFDCASQKP